MGQTCRKGRKERGILRRVLWVAAFAALMIGCRPWSDATPEFKLPVEFYRQERGLSCEASALATVLIYLKVPVTEAQVLGKMPLDSTPRRDGVWGDPDQGFVGDLDGKMGVTGYGIHWAGLAKVAANWRKAQVIESGTAGELVGHLRHGRPVIVWGFQGSKKPLSWKTPAGKTVQAIEGEHTRVVFGFRGKDAEPEGFHVMDPLEGPRFWPLKEFFENWEVFGRKGIVLQPE